MAQRRLPFRRLLNLAVAYHDRYFTECVFIRQITRQQKTRLRIRTGLLEKDGGKGEDQILKNWYFQGDASAWKNLSDSPFRP